MKKKPKVQKFTSSNDQYEIWRTDGSDILKLYARNNDTTFYDLAYTIYNDCIGYLKLSLPLKIEVTFYNSRCFIWIFEIKSAKSTEEVLVDLCKQLKL